MKTAIYPGTFDPITLGHLDIIKRALKIFDKLIIAVGTQEDKKPLFETKERVELVKQTTKDLNVEVEEFSGLFADFAKNKDTNIIIRGLRAVSDFEYEFQMAVMNTKLNKDLETVFLMTDKEHFYLSSSIVREMAAKKANIKDLVPENVSEALENKFQ